MLVEDGGDRGDVSISGFAPARASARRAIDRKVALPAADARVVVSPAAVAGQVGNPDTDDRRSAQTIRATIPGVLREAAYRQEQAAALIFALLLDARADVRKAIESAGGTRTTPAWSRWRRRSRRK